jgi:hypothetical protein
VRPAGARDVPLLRAMLYEAFAWRGDPRFPLPEEALALPEIGRYIDGWGRPFDLGVIFDGDVGAAWIRLFTNDDHGYGFIAADVPELTIGVSSQAPVAVSVPRCSLSCSRASKRPAIQPSA